MIWLLIGYMWLFLHRPFEIWPQLASVHLERVYVIITILFWLASRPALPARNRLHGSFAAFVVVMLASWFLTPCGSVGDGTVENYLKYAVFYFLLVTSVRSTADIHKLIVGEFCIMMLVMAHALREYFNGNAWFAQGIVRMQGLGLTFRDPNDFAGLIVCSMPFAWVLWHWWRGSRLRLAILLYCGMAGYCVMLTGSRMGFIGMVLASILACLPSPKRWRLMAIFPVLFVTIWLVLPADRRARYFTVVGQNEGSDLGVASAGRLRYGGFEAAIPLVAERPLLGFGPMGFQDVIGYMPHNLYGQLLAELGLIGTIAFAVILWGVARNTWQARDAIWSAQCWARESGELTLPDDEMSLDAADLAWWTVLASAASILLLAIMGWGFNFLFWHVWLWFGGIQVVALQCLLKEVEFVLPDEAPPRARSGRVGIQWS